jgi:hypothetical protein
MVREVINTVTPKYHYLSTKYLKSDIKNQLVGTRNSQKLVKTPQEKQYNAISQLEWTYRQDAFFPRIPKTVAESN